LQLTIKRVKEGRGEVKGERRVIRRGRDLSNTQEGGMRPSIRNYS